MSKQIHKQPSDKPSTTRKRYLFFLDFSRYPNHLSGKRHYMLDTTSIKTCTQKISSKKSDRKKKVTRVLNDYLPKTLSMFDFVNENFIFWLQSILMHSNFFHELFVIVLEFGNKFEKKKTQSLFMRHFKTQKVSQ